MSAIDRLRSWLKRESADAKESWGDLRNRADAEPVRENPGNVPVGHQQIVADDKAACLASRRQVNNCCGVSP